ncbi:IS3 family transposase [Candidatus Poribacteria bacterium]|nr:IS3 family transposase [Candidatus Poribacteria bacterium]
MKPTIQREIIKALRIDYSVRQICDTLGLNRSSLYYQPKTKPYEEVLLDEIEKLSMRYPKYGYRRITQMLLRMGYTVGYRRVARIMKTNNLSVYVKHVCQTTQSLKGMNQWVNRIDDLDICRRNQVWVGDITYVRLKERFIYVSVIMDVFTRVIRACHLSQHLTQSLTLRPLQEALQQNIPEIHHSDQGVQYLSSDYISTLTCHGIEISLSRRGRPWENGYAERLIRTLKEEEVYLNEYDNIVEAKEHINHFIVEVYNQKRPGSTLCFLTPIEFEQQYLS